MRTLGTLSGRTPTPIATATVIMWEGSDSHRPKQKRSNLGFYVKSSVFNRGLTSTGVEVSFYFNRGLTSLNISLSFEEDKRRFRERNSSASSAQVLVCQGFQMQQQGAAVIATPCTTSVHSFLGRHSLLPFGRLCGSSLFLIVTLSI